MASRNQILRNAISFRIFLKETHRSYDHVGVIIFLWMKHLIADSLTFPKFNIAPEKLPKPNRKVVLQPPFFRGYLKLRGCTCLFLQTHLEYRDGGSPCSTGLVENRKSQEKNRQADSGKCYNDLNIQVIQSIETTTHLGIPFKIFTNFQPLDHHFHVFCWALSNSMHCNVVGWL